MNMIMRCATCGNKFMADKIGNSLKFNVESCKSELNLMKSEITTHIHSDIHSAIHETAQMVADITRSANDDAKSDT